jgi:hypothetical protein
MRFTNTTRRWILAAVLLSALLIVIMAKFTFALHQKAPSSPQATPALSQPEYGMFEGCAPRNASCLTHLTTIRQGGFTSVVNYSIFMGTPDDIRAYADLATQLHMRLIISFADPNLRNGTPNALAGQYPETWQACQCTTRQAFIRFLVTLVKGLPAQSIWGYYLADEPARSDLSAVVDLSNTIHQLDSHRPRLLVVNSDDTLGLFAQSSLVSMIARDYYPIGRSSDRGSSIQSVASVAHKLQDVATNAGLQSAIVLQAFSLAQRAVNPDDPYTQICGQTQQCTFPTTGEMRQMRDLALHSASVSLVLWYSYPYLIPPRADDPVQRWQAVVDACGCHS